MNIISQTFRISNWWNYKLPPLLAIAYLLILMLNISIADSVIKLMLIMIWMIGAAGFGYYLNDCCDIEQDKKAGKSNQSAEHSTVLKITILISLLFTAIIPWLILGSILSLILVSLQLLAFILYSLPPIRFKERGWAGILLDGIYAHLLPVLIIITAFNDSKIHVSLYLLAIIALWQFMVGFKNIFLHQLEDYAKDDLAGVKTVITENKVENPNKLILIYYIAELLLFSAGVILIIFNGEMLAGCLIIAFLVAKIARYKYFHPLFFKDWKLRMYFMNDFYDEDLSIIFLITLSLHNPLYLGLMFVHLLLFPNFYSRIIKDFKEAN